MPRKKKKTEFDFEKGLSELEELVCQIEQGNSTLEDSLSKFSQAVCLLKKCKLLLKKAEQHVEILLSKNQNDVLEPFEVNKELDP